MRTISASIRQKPIFLFLRPPRSAVITDQFLDIRIPIQTLTVQTAWHLSPDERKALRERDWISLHGHAENSKDFKLALLEFGRSLGTPASTRTRNLVDELTPQDRQKANARSLSRITGTGRQTWHMDLAHRLVPARYLVMGMYECTPTVASTELLDTSMLICDQLREAAFSEPFLIRTGASSFYATMTSKSQPFVRFDPGCMQGVTDRAKQLMQKVLDQDLPATHTHCWEACSILVIDNWKMFHRRADASSSTKRTLYRVSVLGGTG